MSKFGKTERYIRGLFTKGKTFTYDGIDYTIIKSGKPVPSKGECKTDIYVLTVNSKGINKEFKISVKQKDADFLENKMGLPRAIEILGKDAQDIIKSSVLDVKDDFLKDYLVYFNSFKRTAPECIKMGWKFEFLNKNGGERSGLMHLTDQQKVDVYAGTNLNQDKRNCIVSGETIENSGVANFILNVDDTTQNLDFYLKKLEPIESFAKKQDIYFACKALNYRFSKDKWDGDRPLAVYVDWKLDADKKLTGDIIFDYPLNTKGNEIGENIRSILKKLNIGGSFSSLTNFLANDVKVI